MFIFIHDEYYYSTIVFIFKIHTIFSKYFNKLLNGPRIKKRKKCMMLDDDNGKTYLNFKFKCKVIL